MKLQNPTSTTKPLGMKSFLLALIVLVAGALQANAACEGFAVVDESSEDIVIITTYNSTMTYSSHSDLYFDEYDADVVAYVMWKNTDGKFALERVYGIVPAETGLFIRFLTDGPTHTIRYATSSDVDEAEVDGNALQPLFVEDELPVSDDPIANPTKGTVFTYYDEARDSWVNNVSDVFSPSHNAAFVAQSYMNGEIPKPFAPANGNFDDNGKDSSTTAIDTVTADTTSAAGIFSLSGIRYPADTDVCSLAPGFYIVNGKKLLVK
ncbi:MAG: hypothetical protein HUK14_03885 [Muribaculaceae bacterium]|nr:hypothetical protein [Muribaculaceae bacterium]